MPRGLLRDEEEVEDWMRGVRIGCGLWGVIGSDLGEMVDGVRG